MSRNLLDQETSPYLLLHKDNPVNWRPWSNDALAEAEAQDKPICLSIGYTACHWCHVMNEESFSDPETAALMNELYVNIKVDREERPDLDQIYQAAANALGNTGGWPLTMFLTPHGEPYFAVTYLPKEERFGQPAFKKVLSDVARIYREAPEPLSQAMQQVHSTFERLWHRDLRAQLEPAVLDFVAIHIGQRFDLFWGGLTGSPKFPSTGLVELLWRAYLRSGTTSYALLVETSVNAMSLGGIYDHVGGGLHRYSTDERWIVPHFEKMLYDNALYIDLLTLIWQHARGALYKARVEETIGWVLREMKVQDAFASSIDADSEGEEGKYYLWTEAEIDAALKGTFAQRFKEVYDIRRDGNHEGKNVIHRVLAYPLSDADEALLAKQRELLLKARALRKAPMRDDKVLADSNGMMIAALANAGAAFNRPEWTAAAVRAFDFAVKVLGEGDRLGHSWCEGKRQNMGFSDDYAHMAQAAFALWEATREKRFLDQARGWVRMLDEHFWDAQNGGYFYTADDADPLIVRTRMIFDQSTPCANAVMVKLLARLFLVTAEQAYRNRCNALLQAFASELNRAYISMGTYLNGFDLVLFSLQIVIVGPASSPKTQELVSAVRGRSLPNRTLLQVAPGEAVPLGHPAYGKTMENGQPTAYVCQHGTCSAPITNPVTLSQVLLLPQARQAPERIQ
jgi:uncharacterized protein